MECVDFKGEIKPAGVGRWLFNRGSEIWNYGILLGEYISDLNKMIEREQDPDEKRRMTDECVGMHKKLVEILPGMESENDLPA